MQDIKVLDVESGTARTEELNLRKESAEASEASPLLKARESEPRSRSLL